jgi:hypothetical protein
VLTAVEKKNKSVAIRGDPRLSAESRGGEEGNCAESCGNERTFRSRAEQKCCRLELGGLMDGIVPMKMRLALQLSDWEMANLPCHSSTASPIRKTRYR